MPDAGGAPRCGFVAQFPDLRPATRHVPCRGGFRCDRSRTEDRGAAQAEFEEAIVKAAAAIGPTAVQRICGFKRTAVTLIPAVKGREVTPGHPGARA